MEEHPIQGLMKTAMENLKDMIEVNTIIGDPVEAPDGSVIIPVSKVGFGFAAGGSEFIPSSGKQGGSEGSDSDSGGGSGSSSEAVLPFGGGSGGGVSITPVAFLIVSKTGLKMVHLDGDVHKYEKLLDLAPKVVEKIQQLLKESNISIGGKKSDSKGKENSKEKEKDKEQNKEGEDKKKENSESEDKKESDDKKESGEKEKSSSDDSPSIYDL